MSAEVKPAHQNPAPPEPALLPPELPLEPLPAPADPAEPLLTTTSVHLPHVSAMLPFAFPLTLSS